MMDKAYIKIDYEIFETVDELNEIDSLLCKQAVEALDTSYSPYSHFKVGTAAKLANGVVIQGSNQENVAYPSGLCAERVALFTIGASYPNIPVLAMAITASTSNFDIHTPVTSCGACLQVMAEFEQRQKQPIAVLFYCIGGQIIKVDSVKHLLPFGFVEERLSRKA